MRGHQHTDECIESTDFNAPDCIDIAPHQVSDRLGRLSKVGRIEQTFADDVRCTDRADMNDTGVVWEFVGPHHCNAGFRREAAQKILADSTIAAASRTEERCPGSERVEVS